jgi:hypothetical protein
MSLSALARCTCKTTQYPHSNCCMLLENTSVQNKESFMMKDRNDDAQDDDTLLGLKANIKIMVE